LQSYERVASVAAQIDVKSAVALEA